MKWLDRKIDDFIRRVRDNPKTASIQIGPADRPTYRRYFVIRRNRFFNVYLHRFYQSDDEELHDHRMANITLLLQGWCYEERFLTPPVVGQPLPATYTFLVTRLDPLFRWASTPHRVVLERDTFTRKQIGVWSLFIGFPHVRNWGFWRTYCGVACWFPHECFVLSTSPTEDGYGQNRPAA
jgi:hypothetical protein